MKVFFFFISCLTSLFIIPHFFYRQGKEVTVQSGALILCRKGQGRAEKWSPLYFLFMAIISQTRNSPLIHPPTDPPTLSSLAGRSAVWSGTLQGSQQGGAANKGGYAPDRGVVVFKHTFHGLTLWYVSQCGCWQDEPTERCISRPGSAIPHILWALCIIQQERRGVLAKAEADPLHSDLCSTLRWRTRGFRHVWQMLPFQKYWWGEGEGQRNGRSAPPHLPGWELFPSSSLANPASRWVCRWQKHKHWFFYFAS